MGEVGEAGGAEDQGQAHGGQRQQQAEAEPGHEPVEQVLAEVLLLDHDALAEGEDHREVGGLAERDVAGIFLAVGQFDALRQGGFVQLDLVGALNRDADAPGPVGAMIGGPGEIARSWR